MSYLFITFILAVAAVVCGYLWLQSQGQTRLVAGIAAVGFGSLAAMNGLSWILSLSRRLMTLAIIVVVIWAVFTLVTRR